MSFVRPLIVIGVFLFSSRWLCKAGAAILNAGPWNPNSFCDGRIEQMRKTAQRQRIPLGSKPGDHAIGAKRDIGVVAEFLALVDVRDVDFDNRRFEGIQRVEDRNRRMCERGRIDYDATRNVSCFMNPVDDLVFTVRLVEAKFKSVLFGNLAAIGLDIGKSLVTVDVRLAFAEEIEIGTIQYVDDTTHNWLRISMLG